MRLAWNCPIILVDQSDDEGAGIARLLSRCGFENVVHRVQKRRGTSAARNEGARWASTSWIIFIDDDVRPVEDYWNSLYSFISENPWVDAVQGAVEYDWTQYCTDRNSWEYKRKQLSGSRAISEQHWGGLEWLLRTPRAKYSCMALGLGSGNLAVSRESFLSAGGFDEQCDGLGEDIEFGLRLWWYGYRACLCPDAVAFHLRAPFGGTRQQLSRWQSVFMPDPPPSLIYFLLKWFPGRPFWEEIAKQSAKWFRRPWVIPVKLVRLLHSMRVARERLRQGPRYLCEPVCRPQAFNRRQLITSAGGLR
jgi:cellulose synthase/poly-beta-1,6-N-acetylglucosamine synthase-like glycosyltransferase